MFMKKLSRHLPHYLPLIGIFVFGVAGFWIFSYDRIFQISITIAIGASYVSWGIIHHYLHHDLHWKVVLEYLGISLIGLGIILSLVLQS
ncbi:MAG: hypothetical protein UV74_C0013G0405 [Candidatus Woesebacteria bacterium GW2011_GWB1_43_14]|uniref:Uncharacterized protein n=1 Tax=Candidatus Woesebacteria bacterium GW2011_GWB1_43_14 TaxID=1618578 RepID=A0A0G1GEJ0_9BACT|nr:MAG: hypothetical protein UT21_C0001G0117 [Candidatus Woesebacteria bacterium GW2011_GWA1_39_11b]KKS78298.1 MAG: hypothetical protein UV51_C0001G0014 [Candidatus Woesebacteria bacterium GW2011_GWC1_42_9]KKS97283.1 MAG: hypothetical protein UV74_C0013G0405 [Candidatus Woesebacteria bacterium GW2011_GWB1_43_14]